MRTDAMILVFWILSFKPTSSLSSFTFIKRIFSSYSLSALKVVSSACLRLLIVLPEILIPACASSSLAFHMMFSAFKLNKHGDNIHPWHTPLPIWNQSIFPCLTSQEAGQVVWYSHLLKNFPQFVVIYTVKSFGVVKKAKVDYFLELSCFVNDSAEVGKLISGSSAFPKSRLIIWKFMVHILLKPDLENFEHYFTSMWDKCNCAVVWAFFGTASFWYWNENWLFPVLWPLLSFPNLLAYWVQHFHIIIFQDLK